MLELFPHNQTAYDAALEMLRESGKACIVHPTGTGKSFIGFKYCEEHPGDSILWLAPTSYIYQTQVENWSNAGGEPLYNVNFITYPKLMNMSDEEILELHPDFEIYDEFHRCGAEHWGSAVERLRSIFPDVPMLGLSATNVRYLDNQRDMADEMFDSCIASEMTLGEAIVRGILKAPKYVTAVYSYQKQLERYEDRVKRAPNAAVRDTAERYLQALRRALEKADGLDVIFDKHMTDRTGKYIVFCSNEESMKLVKADADNMFRLVDKAPHIYSVYSNDPYASRSFRAFKNDNDDTHLRILLCIDALNEGIHVDDISGVILFRPTVSPIVYKQQIGRSLSASGNRIPVIFDIVNNFENLYSVGMIEEEMKAAITYYQYFGEGQEIVNESFKVIDELVDCKKLFDELEGVLTASWDTMYKFAEQYFDEYGTIEDLPQKYVTAEGYHLGDWVKCQRNIRNGVMPGVLTDERIEKLDKLGMRWESINDVSWRKHIKACEEYVRANGNLLVPTDYITEDGIKLGTWIISARKYKAYGIKNNYFTAEREKQLDELGMIWDQVNDYIWERNFDAAEHYYREHGDINKVPKGYIQDGVKLSLWLQELREIYRGKRKGSFLTEEKIVKLESLGMRWKTTKEIAWDKGIEEARKYTEVYGQFDTPVKYITPEGYKLGVFLSKCREKYSKGKLTEEELAQLEELHIVWCNSRKNDWNECFAHIQSYYLEHGDLKIPANYTADGIWLNKWLNEQKQILLGNRKGKSLNPDQIEKLKSVSFVIKRED